MGNRERPSPEWKGSIPESGGSDPGSQHPGGVLAADKPKLGLFPASKTTPGRAGIRVFSGWGDQRVAPGGPRDASPAPRMPSGVGSGVGRPSAPTTLQDREDPVDRVRRRPRPGECEGSLPIWGLKRNRPPLPPRRRSLRRYLHRRAPLRRSSVRRRARSPTGPPLARRRTHRASARPLTTENRRTILLERPTTAHRSGKFGGG